MRKFYILFSLSCTVLLVNAQQYAIVIKGGRVIDPKNNIDAVMDIAINDGRIVEIAKDIDARRAIQTVDASGLLVTPGLIDMHVHVFYGVEPDHAYSNGMASVV